jgi:hypothetical protein
MTSLETIKRAVANTLCNDELIDSAFNEIEAYSRCWHHILIVNSWDVWNGSRRVLKLQVVRWLEDRGGLYDFSRFNSGLSVIGFKDLNAATHFELRWSSHGRVMSRSIHNWNSQPLKSIFEALPFDEVQPPNNAPSLHCDSSRQMHHEPRSYSRNQIDRSADLL